MKKTFSCVMTLFASIMLLVTSCNNASQVTFVDSSKNNYTDDGLSALTIRVGNEPTYRNIWPEDWTEETKSNLLYVLSGTENGGSSKKFGILNNTKPGYFDNDGSGATLGADKQNVFTWDEISHNKAVINLEPISWDLTLTAVQIADPDEFGKKDITNAKKVLASEAQTVDLTSGAKEEIFKLVTNLDDTTALGSVDIQVQFFNEDAAKVAGAKFEVIKTDGTDLVNAADNGVNGKLTSGKGTATIGGDAVGGVKVQDVIDSGAFSVIAGRNLSAIQLAGTLPIGNHQLKVHFYNEAGDDVLTYEEPILIEGGNTSRSVIKIPEGQMGKAPEQPIDLQASVAFVPTKGTIVDVVVDGGKKVKAQVLETTGTKPADICENYNVTFTWKDMSYNETGFRLVLTGVDDKVTVLENSPSDPGHAAAPIKVIGTDNASATWVDETGDGIKNNSLDAGSQRVVLSLPLTYHLKEAKIYAVNNFVKFGADGVTVTSPSSLTTIETLTKHIGMFTVSYCLTTNVAAAPDSKKVAKINYNNGNGTTITQTNGTGTENVFVMGYEVGTKDAMVTKVGDLISEVSVPSISLAGSADLKFGKWVQSLDTGAPYDSSQVGAGTEITDELLNDDLTTGPGATIVSNIVVHPVFVTPFTVKVEFPSYSDYKELNVSPNIANKNESNVIRPQAANGQIVVTALAAPSSSLTGTIETYEFTVKAAGGVEVLAKTGTVPETDNGQYGRFTVADNVLTWDTTTATVGGNYTIYVEYDHKDANNNIKHIGGTLYVEFSK